jgi:uncharacterized protein (TIGR03435 family)
MARIWVERYTGIVRGHFTENATFRAVQHVHIAGHGRILRVKLASTIRRSNHSATLLALVAAMPLAFAQPPSSNSATPAKPIAFDVVSIRPANPGSNFIVGFATTPDGYRVPSQSLWFTIMMAYFPQNMAYWSKDRLPGAPPWINDPYEIDAKVSEADLAECQKQGLTLNKKPMLQQMLKTMLADRCHLVAHMAPGPPVSGFSLELGKHGPHFTESKPDEVLPEGMKLPDGGIEVPYRGESPRFSFYGATMADVAQFLSMISAGHPVLDHTGLAGRYDLIVNWLDDPDSKLPAGVVGSHDTNTLSHWDFEPTGLHLAPIKIPADTLVIDHIEKPSEN